ncbi:KUP/HAK/KT family potassium transporter [Micromonospora rifamycinica]
MGALGVVFGDIGTSPIYTMQRGLGAYHPERPEDGRCMDGALALADRWARRAASAGH